MAHKDLNETWWKIIEKFEKILLRVIILGLIALFLAQSLLTVDSMRFYLSWAERLEGEPLPGCSGSTARVMETDSGIFANLTIELKDFSSLAKADLLINGEKAADFRNKKVIVKVYPEDILEIDGSFYNLPVDFQVVKVSENILEPALNRTVKTENNVALLGKVRFK